MNIFTCPGFVFYPLCCGESVIMYGWVIVEGRYHLIPMGRPEFETSTNMNTVELMLQLTIVLWGTGMEVKMDSVFCFLKRILKNK